MIKGAKSIEALSSADTFIFDKTGTLTGGELEVISVESYNPKWTEEQILNLTASTEEHYFHPVAEAVVKAAKQRGFVHMHHEEVEFIVAHGVKTEVDGKSVVIGSRHFLEDDEKIDFTPFKEKISKSLEDGKYLDVSDGGNKNGQNVGFSDYTGENNQRWYIKNGSSGKILIPKNATGSCLDISNNGSAVGTNAQIWAQAGVAAQEFSIYTQSNIPNFINFGDDFYANIIKASTWSTLVNKNPNLEVGGEGEAEGSDIWHFRRMKDGTYIIQSLFDGKYLDVEKFSDQKGANVYCYDYTGDMYHHACGGIYKNISTESWITG
jgi:hypothetical protein